MALAPCAPGRCGARLAGLGEGQHTHPYTPIHPTPHLTHLTYTGPPWPASSALAWHGSSVHWGGACSSYAEEEPRASLTAVLRLRSAPRTQLQGAQDLPELGISALPLPLAARVRYVASALLVYSYWYSLGRGVLPSDMLLDEDTLA